MTAVIGEDYSYFMERLHAVDTNNFSLKIFNIKHTFNNTFVKCNSYNTFVSVNAEKTRGSL